MTLKQFKVARLVTTFALAVLVSQAIIFEKYIIPLIAVIVASLILTLLRRRVKEVIADERDYAIGGKAALRTIAIYGWLATITMFLLYAFKDQNGSFEAVAFTLAVSTCLLMLLYSGIFRFINRSGRYGK